jgi:hypothetical protein
MTFTLALRRDLELAEPISSQLTASLEIGASLVLGFCAEALQRGVWTGKSVGNLRCDSKPTHSTLWRPTATRLIGLLG